MRNLLAIPLIIFMVLLTVFLLKLTSIDVPKKSPMSGKPLPEFSLKGINPNGEGLSSVDLKGKYALLTFRVLSVVERLFGLRPTGKLGFHIYDSVVNVQPL